MLHDINTSSNLWINRHQLLKYLFYPSKVHGTGPAGMTHLALPILVNMFRKLKFCLSGHFKYVRMMDPINNTLVEHTLFGPGCTKFLSIGYRRKIAQYAYF